MGERVEGIAMYFQQRPVGREDVPMVGPAGRQRPKKASNAAYTRTVIIMVARLRCVTIALQIAMARPHAPAAVVLLLQVAEMRTVSLNGKQITVYKGTSPAEDDAWVLITDLLKNGNKVYKCLVCGATWKGGESRVISHFLRLAGEGVSTCAKAPPERCVEVCKRIREAKASVSRSKRSLAKDDAAAKTPKLAATDGVMTSLTERIAAADEALANWAVHAGIPWTAICSRQPYFSEAIKKILQVGSIYVVPRAEVLSCVNERPEGTRQGGLFLGVKSMQRSKKSLLKTAAETGGTLVADGAKLKCRKRAMLNTALIVTKGVHFVQQTDTTGDSKTGEYQELDLSSAIESCGEYSEVSRKVGDFVESKKVSSVVKFVILDRGGGCTRALKLVEEKWAIATASCKGHLADLFMEDLAKPFMPHIKTVHAMIIFIISHDFLLGKFSAMEGARALLLPAETRFATELICVRSLTRDRQHIESLFTNHHVNEWAATQNAEMKAKFRKHRGNALSLEWWHRCDVFVAIEEVAETSLRILDSDTPNLKDAAFAYDRLQTEYGDALLGKLSALKDWGDIDLRLDLSSEYMGSLSGYIKSCMRKRHADWNCPLVLAAAAVNPVYSFSVKEIELWKVPNGDRAVRAIFAQLFWGNVDELTRALDGWNRFQHKEGIYEEQEDVLGRKVYDPLSFFRHVKGCTTLTSDVAFSTAAIWLVSAFACQSASERMNKYMTDVQGPKQKYWLNTQKGKQMLALKMHLVYKNHRRQSHQKEQKESILSGQLSVAHDLRATYVALRESAKEAEALRKRLAEIQEGFVDSEHDGDDDNDEEPRSFPINLQDAIDVVGAGDELGASHGSTILDVIPPGYIKRIEPPPGAWLDFSQPIEQTNIVGKKLMMKWESFGWCLGKVLRRNGDQRRKTGSGAVANFILAFEIDEGSTTAALLSIDKYNFVEDAPFDSWFLLDVATTNETADAMEDVMEDLEEVHAEDFEGVDAEFPDQLASPPSED